MSEPVFAAGQKVLLTRAKLHPPAQGAYRIVSAMPDDRGGFQYRIKGDLEKFERVIEERHLAAD